MKRIALVALILLFFIGLAGCSKEPGKTKIVLSEVTHSVFYAPQYVAMNQGFFAEEGLELELLNGAGADKVMASLLSKDADIGLMGPESTLYVYLNGQSDYIVNFAQLTQRDGSFIVAREAIPNFDITMLKGKSILGGRAGGMPEMTLEYVIKTSGLTLMQNGDEAMVNVRTDVAFAAMAGAFIAGEGDFTTLFEPTATQIANQNQGYIVASVGTLSGEIPYTAYNATLSYINENEEVIEKFVRAIYKGQKFVQTNSDEVVAQALQEYFSETSLADLVQVVARYRSIDAWCDTPYFGENGYNRMLDVMIAAGVLNERPSYSILVNNDIVNKILND